MLKQEEETKTQPNSNHVPDLNQFVLILTLVGNPSDGLAVRSNN